VFGCFGLSLLSSLMTIASFAVAGGLLGQTVTWDAAFLAGPLVIVANCLPFTPGGIGLAETVSSELFAHLGSAYGAEIMVLTRICGALLSLPGILPILMSAGPGDESLSEIELAPVPANDGPATESRIASHTGSLLS
jgi:uncharacterized membrane protein YbhN (UPF0104 family)